MNIQKKKKIALVLSGGGIKAAAYHIGVCLALKEKGFAFSGGPKEWVQQKYPTKVDESNSSVQSKPTIKLYVGSSAGAFVASVLASGKSLESLITAFQVGFGNVAAETDNEKVFTICMMIIAGVYYVPLPCLSTFESSKRHLSTH